MAYDITGTISHIGPTEAKSERFSKRLLWLDVEDGRYPQVVELQATGDRCALLDQFSTGDKVKVAFNLRGRRWTGQSGTKVFNSCDIWRVELVAKAAGSSQGGTSGDSDIPF